MNSIEFLDAARESLGLTSDNQLAGALGIGRDRISKIRTGTRKIDDALAVKIAGALDVAPGYVMAEVQAERAKRTEIRNAWHAVAETVKKSQAAAVLASVAIGGLVMPYFESARAASECILC